MRVSLVVTSALVIAALSPSRSHAQSRVSIELGGMVSAYDVSPNSSTTGVVRGASTIPNPTSSGTTGVGGNGVGGVVAGRGPAGDGIAAFEVRPTITLDSGFLLGVGFRTGQAGLSSDSNSSLVGGDIAIGYAKRFGRFLPFLKGMFGLNSYDIATPNGTGHQTDLRLDAVLGSRLYVSQRLYVAAAAFAGWGDRYGGSLSVGGDVVQIFRRGVMP
jgi:hypothetical protein